MLQLQASKLVNRKNKAKEDKNRNIPQPDPNLNVSTIKEENICLKVTIILRLFPARAVDFTRINAKLGPYFIMQIVNGYFTWTQGCPTLTNIDIKIPFGELCVILLSLTALGFVSVWSFPCF